MDPRRKHALEAYGGACVCCGERHLYFLCFDHIGGGGNEHRKSVSAGALVSWLRKSGYPPEFQLLCANCNGAKGSGKPCPGDHNQHARDYGTGAAPNPFVGYGKYAAYPGDTCHVGHVLEKVGRLPGTGECRECHRDRNAKVVERRKAIVAAGRAHELYPEGKCIHNHDIKVVGTDMRGVCQQCARGYRRNRAEEWKNRTECVRGHDATVLGFYANGYCKQCAKDDRLARKLGAKVG